MSNFQYIVGMAEAFHLPQTEPKSRLKRLQPLIPGGGNTTEQIDAFLQALPSIIESLRGVI